MNTGVTSEDHPVHTNLPQTTLARLETLQLRQRLETIAFNLYVLARVSAGRPPAKHAHVQARLLLLAALTDHTEWIEAVELARRAGRVFKRTSDFLHARVPLAAAPSVVLAEWRAVVKAMEDRVARLIEAHGQ